MFLVTHINEKDRTNKINKNTFWKEVFDAGKKEELFLE